GAPQAPGLFDQEPKSHGVWRADGAEASDWQWSDRKHGSSGGQSATQRGEHLLVSSQRRGDLAVALVLQGGALEPIETYGHFTLGSVGSLTGTMGTRPPKSCSSNACAKATALTARSMTNNALPVASATCWQ